VSRRAKAKSARLFVALPLPAGTRGALAGLAPGCAPGIRPQRSDDLHVTLHFLGMADIDEVKSALTSVTAPAFTATLTLPGQFFARGHPRTLFVGMAPVAPLRELHAQIGRQLESAGFPLDSKPFVPHITLARLDRTASTDSIAAFLGQALPPEAMSFDCKEFALYASETLPDGARYRVLERYPLKPVEPAAGA
jgi:2'-5' RNA ligase